jgi:pimeloyl-ACP methyl ester carboxylesterase
VGAVLRALKGMANSVEPDSVQTHLGEIAVPVRLLVGTGPHDSGVSAAKVLIMQTRIPQFAVDSVPGVGLHIHEEAPDALVAEILRMLGKDAG